MEIIDDNERKRKKKKEIISPLESEKPVETFFLGISPQMNRKRESMF